MLDDALMLLHFRSSIDRPLNLPQYPGRKYIINNWGLMKIKLFWMKWCLFYFYQRGNQNPYIEEEQTTQWQKEKVQKDKQRSTKHTYKTKDRVTRTPVKTGGKLRWYSNVTRFDCGCTALVFI
jgi:hypothetical protein